MNVCHIVVKNNLYLIRKVRVCMLNYFVSTFNLNSIILSDIDSYFIKNPWSLIFHIESIYGSNNVDIIGQRGHWPENNNLVNRIENTAICIGFVYFKITNKTLKLFSDINYNLNLSDDTFFSDQETFNRYINQQKNVLNKNIIKTYKDTRDIFVSNLTFIQNYWNKIRRDSYTISSESLNVFLLPSFISLRYHCGEYLQLNRNISFYYSTIYNIHCINGKSFVEKRETISNIISKINYYGINYYLLTNKIYFVHIPKTGGLFIETLFKYKLNITIGKYYHNERNDFLNIAKNKLYLNHKCGGNHIPLKHSLLPNDILFFAIVRNPYNRILSEYKHFGGSDAIYRFRRKEYLIEANIVNESEIEFTENFLCDKINFNKILFQTLSYIKTKNSSFEALSDCHYVKQIQYIPNIDILKKINFIILQHENLNYELFYKLLWYGKYDLFKSVESIINFYKNEFLFKLDTHFTFDSCNKLTMHDIDKSNRKLIEEIYYEDFIRFGYPFLT